MSDNKIKLRFPDGAVKEYPAGVKPIEVAEGISAGLARSVVGAVLDEELWDLHRPIESGEHDLRLVRFDDPEGKEFYWHTSAHLLATAVRELFPAVRFGIGPAISNGFYYDFLTDKPFTEDDLAAIENKMRELIKADLSLERREIDRAAARKEMEKRGESLKVELIDDLPADAEISFYQSGDFVDLCKGPHLPSTKQIGVVKLLSVAGAYWRGDEKRPMLSRIYGVSFPKKKQLTEYLERIEEAKRRDHRKIGAEMELFSVAENHGPGMVLYHPAGAVLRHEIEQLGHEMHQQRGYQLVSTPHLFKSELWKISGHYEHYKDKMFFAKLAGDDSEYAIKPMNCPGHVLIFKHGLHSYRELPIRYYEYGTVYRNEMSGVLHGMMRVRGFTIDDAHIFCRLDQLEEEIIGVVRFAQDLLGVFGLKMTFDLSTKPDNAMGEDAVWEKATSALVNALESQGLDYVVDEGGGAFYGPKIDIHVTDALGRRWQTSTCQVDFNFPERFNLEYVGQDGKRHKVVMVHRAITGSFERFIGILIEHFAGKFPLWMAPEQARILPVSDEQNAYAEEVQQALHAAGLKRVTVDTSNNKLGAKVAHAETEHVNYLLVVGGREQETKTVNLRARGRQNLGDLSIKELTEKLAKEVRTRKLPVE